MRYARELVKRISITLKMNLLKFKTKTVFTQRRQECWRCQLSDMALLTNDVNLGSIAHACIVGWWVHELHFADVEPCVYGPQPLDGEVHFVSTGSASAGGVIQEGQLIVHCVCRSADFSHLAASLPQNWHPDLGGFAWRPILTHKAGDASAAGQHHCRLGHVHA